MCRVDHSDLRKVLGCDLKVFEEKMKQWFIGTPESGALPLLGKGPFCRPTGRGIVEEPGLNRVSVMARQVAVQTVEGWCESLVKNQSHRAVRPVGSR